jgi:hypothetical protein
VSDDRNNPFSEHSRRRRAERESAEFFGENMPAWDKAKEESVVKVIRLWCATNGYAGEAHIFVCPTLEARYHLVFDWALSDWLRDSENVYEIPMEPDEHEKRS